jgi:amidohydrolase
LLFQPAEEIEQGAKDVVEDPAFKAIEPDYIFALHNIPGEPKKMILLRNGVIAAASKGMTVKLKGKTSHAAEPENGISPAKALSLLIGQLQELVTRKDLFKDMALLTIIHIRMGELSFGTTPGNADMMITLRAVNNEDMALMAGKAEKIILDVAAQEGLSCEISYSEVFPALVNDPECVKLAESAAKDNMLETKHLDRPYKWSEDFSYFSMKYKACFFGLGAGQQQAQLHNPDFDFPDDILETGVNLFYSIYKTINLKDA